MRITISEAETISPGAVFRAALDLILPPRCAACAIPLLSHEPFCELCWQSVVPLEGGCPRCGIPDHTGLCERCRQAPPPFISARSPLLYGGQLAVAIRLLKYSGRSYLARPLASLLGPALDLSGPRPVVVPVPLHPRRLRRRGYNQAAVLALELARTTGLQVRHEGLVRRRDTHSQVRLSRQARLQNLRGAFLARPAAVRGARVLLLDDVMTTGATATACAEALCDAGARQVRVLTLARSPVESYDVG